MLGSRSYIKTPSGLFVDAALVDIAGASRHRQTVEACPPHFSCAVQRTRPADTVAYTSGDVYADSTSAATVITFAGAGRANGGGGLIRTATLVLSQNGATKPEFELWLWYGNTAPTTPNDNVAWAPTDANLYAADTRLLGIITFAVANGVVGDPAAGGNFVYFGTLGKSTTIFNLNMPYMTGNAVSPNKADLYGIMVLRNAPTPVSAETIAITLGIDGQE